MGGNPIKEIPKRREGNSMYKLPTCLADALNTFVKQTFEPSKTQKLRKVAVVTTGETDRLKGEVSRSIFIVGAYSSNLVKTLKT